MKRCYNLTRNLYLADRVSQSLPPLITAIPDLQWERVTKRTRKAQQTFGEEVYAMETTAHYVLKAGLLAAIVTFTGVTEAVCTATAYAAPVVSNAPTSIREGDNITISGAGFGTSGPNILLFDDFETGSVGSVIKTGPDSATIGQWKMLNSVPPTYSSDTSVSGRKAFKATSAPGIEGHTNAYIALPSVTETFISWWCYVPTTSPWSGEGTSSGINWKNMWIMQNSTTDNDLAFPVKLSATTHLVGGNNTPLVYPDTEPWQSQSMAKGVWHRYWTWIKDGYSGDGTIKVWELTASGPLAVKTVSNKTTLYNLATRKLLSVNAYTRNQGSGTQSVQMFDDIYVATGPNSQARIEIGTGCTGGSYFKCTNLAVSTATSWSDASITATARIGRLSGPAHLFVIDGNGTVSSGIPVNVSNAPSAPSLNLKSATQN